MRFGTICTWGGALSDYLAQVSEAEKAGFELIGTGDSQSVAREVYVALSMAASSTNFASIGPLVTNPLTRHPAVTASAIAALDLVSSQRAVLGIGSGDSAVRNLGLRPARLRELSDYVQSVRSLLMTGTATWNGAVITIENPTGRIPIVLAAEGPRTLQLAGAISDAVILHCGTSPESVEWSIGHLAAGAHEAGRDPTEIEIWMMLKTSVAETKEDAMAPIKMGLAASAHHAYRYALSEKRVPPELVPKLAELIRRYDTTQHEVAGGSNSALPDQLGLTDFLADSFGLIGTADECVARLMALERCGIGGVLLPALGPNPIGLLKRLGSEVIPRVRQATSQRSIGLA